MPDPSSSNSYSSMRSGDLERRYRIINDELPELDSSTMYSLASSVTSDAAMLDQGLKVLAAGSMDRIISEFNNLPKPEQRSRWNRMSEAKRAIYSQNGYKEPKASSKPAWQYPFAGIAWVTDKLGIDSLIENSHLVEAGQWAMDKVSNLADDVAGRFYRYNRDISHDEQAKRIEVRLNQAISQLADEGYAVTDQGAEYLKWKLLDDSPEYIAPKRQDWDPNGISNVVNNVSELIGNRKIDWKPYQPRKGDKLNAFVPDAIYQRFIEINDDLKEGKEFALSPRDAWSRVDTGKSYITPSIQLKIQETLKGESPAAFNAALALSRGQELGEYVKETEGLTPQTPEFANRMFELKGVLSRPDVETAIDQANRDQSKVSMGRDVARSLGINDRSSFFTLVSGAVDAAHVIFFDPILIGGKGVKIARVAKSVASIGEIAEVQRVFNIARLGAEVGKDGRFVLEPLEQLTERVGSLKTSIAAAREAGASTSKLEKSLAKVQQQINLRKEVSFFESADIQRANKGFERLQSIFPQEVLDEYGIKEYGSLLDENGLPTQWLIDNQDAVANLLDDAQKHADNILEYKSAQQINKASVENYVVDPETGEIIYFATDKFPTSKFTFQNIDETALEDVFQAIKASQFTVGRIVDPSKIAAAYNATTAGVTAGEGILSEGNLLGFLTAAPDSRLAGSGIRFGSWGYNKAPKALATRRVKLASKVGAWTERAAQAFVEHEANVARAFGRWIDDVPDAILVHQDLLNWHNALKVNRGFGIVDANDVFEFLKSADGVSMLTSGRGSNLAVKGFGAGKFGVNQQARLFGSAMDDVVKIRDRSALLRLPTYNGNKLMRRTLGKLSGERFTNLSRAIEYGVELGAESERASVRIGGKLVRGPAKFVYQLTRQVPRRAYIALDDTPEIKRFLDSTAFLGLGRETRDILFEQILGGFATDQTIRFMRADLDFAKVMQKLTTAGEQVLSGEGQRVYNSSLASEFFEEFGQQKLFNEFDGTFAASDHFNNQYDEIQKWINASLQDDPTRIGDEFLKEIMGFQRDLRPVTSYASRRYVIENAISDLFNTAGFRNTEEGAQAVDELMAKFANQRYSAIGNDIIQMGSTTRRAGVLPVVHSSDHVAIPVYQDMVADGTRLGFLGRILGYQNRKWADVAINKYWKPLVLMRIGFIPRAVGEEGLAFLARTGFDGAQAIASSLVMKESRGPISELLFKAARGLAKREAEELWANPTFVKNFGNFTAVLPYENLQNYMRDVGRQLGKSGFEFKDWNYRAFFANYATAKFAEKVRRLEYALVPDRIKAALPGLIRNENRMALYQGLGLAGAKNTKVAVEAWINESARAMLREPYLARINLQSHMGIGHTIVDEGLGGYAATEGREVTLKSSGNESYVLRTRQDHEWLEIDTSGKLDDATWAHVMYPYSLNNAEPTMQAGFDALQGMVTPAEAQDVLLHSARKLGYQPVLREATDISNEGSQIVEDVIRGLSDEAGRPLYSQDAVDLASRHTPIISPEQQQRITSALDNPPPGLADVKYSDVVDELRRVIRGDIVVDESQILSDPYLSATAQQIADVSGLNALPVVSPSSPQIYHPQDIVDFLNDFTGQLTRDFDRSEYDQLVQLLTHPGQPLEDGYFVALNKLSPESRALVEKYGEDTLIHDFLSTAENIPAIRETSNLHNQIDNVKKLFNIDRRTAMLIADEAKISIVSQAEQANVLRDAIYLKLNQMARDPNMSKYIHGSERMLFDVGRNGSGLSVLRAPTPGATSYYGVMADRNTVDFLQTVYNEGRVNEFIEALRPYTNSDEELDFVRQMFLEWDSRKVNRLINNNQKMLNGNYMPFSTFGFKTYDQANEVSDLLSRYALSESEKAVFAGDIPKLHFSPGTVDLPPYVQNIVDDAGNKIYSNVNYQGIVRFHDDTFVSRMQPYSTDRLYRYDNVGHLNPDGQYVLEGIPVDDAISRLADILTDEFLYYYDTGDGLLHQVMIPSRRGQFSGDVFRNVTPEQLPAKIYAPREYVEPLDRWSRMVRYGFDKVIGPAIESLARAPQWIVNYADGLLSSRTLLAGLRDPEADARIISFLDQKAADLEDVRDIFVDVYHALGGPSKITPDDLETVIRAKINRAEMPVSILESPAYQSMKYQNVLDWAAKDYNIEQIAQQSAYRRAVELTIPYIDDHAKRSIFQVHVRNLMPFEFAQEAFLKRWANTVRYSPEAIRRAQLIAHGFTSLPITEKTKDGETMMVVPLSETAGKLFSRVPILNTLFGQGSLKIPVSVPFSGNVKYMLPGVPRDFGQLPSVSPLVAFPANQLITHFPEVAGIQTRSLLRPFTGGMPVKPQENLAVSFYESFMPSNYARLMTALVGGVGRYEDEMNGAAIGAAQMLMAEAIRLRAEASFAEAKGDATTAAELYQRANSYDPPDNATAIEREHYLDNVKDWARAQMFVKGFLGWFMPMSPKEEFKDIELNSEFSNLLNYMSLEEATAFFLSENPDRQPYTVFKYDKETTAPLPATEASLKWMDNNREVMKDYKYGAPWMLPQQDSEDSFSQQAFADQTAAGMRFMKSLEDWYRGAKYAAGGNVYFPEQEAYLKAIDQTSTPVERSLLESKWQMWSQTFKDQHPVFAEELNQNFDQRTQASLDEVRTLLNDPQLEAADHHDALRTLVEQFDLYDGEIKLLRNDNSKLGRRRKNQLQEDFISWGQNYIRENRTLVSFWNTIIIPASNLRKKETLMSLARS